MNGLKYGWLYRLAEIIDKPYTQRLEYDVADNSSIKLIKLENGPSRKTMYVTGKLFL